MAVNLVIRDTVTRKIYSFEHGLILAEEILRRFPEWQWNSKLFRGLFGRDYGMQCSRVYYGGPALRSLGVVVSATEEEGDSYLSYCHMKYRSCKFEVLSSKDYRVVNPLAAQEVLAKRMGFVAKPLVLANPKHFWRKVAYQGYRKIRTTNELRQAFPVVEDGEPPIRGRRNRRGLPNAWDDIYGWTCKNWKKQRKVRKQWMRNK